jgi:NTP pyrophosphatase (non-canonical NTP hydrolase)
MISDIDIKDFEGYQQEAWKFAKPTAKNPPILFGNLGGEAGEVLSVWAKSVRDETSPEEFYGAITKELGDVLWQISGIATYYGLSLQDIAEANIVKLKSRQQRGVIGGSGDDR